MSDQRAKDAAEHAVADDADPTEGQGLGAPAAHPGSGRVGGGATTTDDLDSPVGPDDRGAAFGGGDTDSGAETEGARHIEETAQAAQAQPAVERSDERAATMSGVPPRSDLDDGLPPDGPAIRAARDEGISRHE